MNILYLTTHLNIGGITSYVLSLAKGLKGRGHNVYVASSGGEFLPQFIKEGINHISIPIKTKQEFNPKVLMSGFKLLKFIKEKNINIIHANTRVTQVLGCLLHRYSHKPYICTCHGFFKRRLSRRVFGDWGNIVIAISEAVKEHLMRDFKVKEEDIRVIYNGIDVDDKSQIPNPKSQMEIKKNLGLGDGPVVGIIARLSDVKGHIYLIKAMRVVLTQIPNAQLLIVGEGKQKKGLVDLVRDLGIEKSVFFLPPVTDTREVLSIMDLFVMPSLKEGLGLSLMEAQAQGLAVIGTGVGGMKSLIQDGYNGILVKPADIDELSLAILKLLRDSEIRIYLGNNARNFIKQNFSLERMLLETESVYQECLNIKY